MSVHCLRECGVISLMISSIDIDRELATSVPAYLMLTFEIIYLMS